MPPSDQPVIDILIRDQNGQWQSMDAVNLQGDENVLLLPTTKGQVMIVGNLDEEDYSDIEPLLKKYF
jgi:hypothetical protein